MIYIDTLTEAEFPSAGFGEDRNTGGMFSKKNGKMKMLGMCLFLETMSCESPKEWSQEVLNENAGCYADSIKFRLSHGEVPFATQDAPAP